VIEGPPGESYIVKISYKFVLDNAMKERTMLL